MARVNKNQNKSPQLEIGVECKNVSVLLAATTSGTYFII
jgi:hypothetical protein